MAKFKYFTYSEFDCKSGIGQGEIFMNHKFIEMLDDARTIANVPFIITSGFSLLINNSVAFESLRSNTSFEAKTRLW